MQARVLAPDAERFLRRPVRDREQHRFLECRVGVRLPWWHDKNVLRTPFENLAVHRRPPLPFGTDEDGAVGRAVFLALESLWKQREIGAHGGEHRSAVDGIGVAHARAMAL